MGNLRHTGTKKRAQVHVASKGQSWDLNLALKPHHAGAGKANKAAHGEPLWKLEIAACTSTNWLCGPTLITLCPSLVFLFQQEDHRGKKKKKSKQLKKQRKGQPAAFCRGCSKPLPPTCPSLGGVRNKDENWQVLSLSPSVLLPRVQRWLETSPTSLPVQQPPAQNEPLLRGQTSLLPIAPGSH